LVKNDIIKILELFLSCLSNSNEAAYTLKADIKYSFDLIQFLMFENSSHIYAKDNISLYPSCGIFF